MLLLVGGALQLTECGQLTPSYTMPGEPEYLHGLHPQSYLTESGDLLNQVGGPTACAIGEAVVEPLPGALDPLLAECC